MMDREFDIVLFGATGFVGALAAAHLATVAGPEVHVALAGRSMARLETVRGQLAGTAGSWGLLEVDATDTKGLASMASRTRVLATTVGPYSRYGKQVVRAAAKAGTHYVDLTGEVLFVRWTLDEVAAHARETGAKIVHSCGFDSIPSDLGVLLTAERAAADGQGTLRDTRLVVRSMKGGISGGTIDSLRQQANTTLHDPAASQVLHDPYALSPRRAEEPPQRPRRPGSGRRLPGWAPAERDPETGHWLGLFAMAGYNTRMVRLSNTLTDWSYGRELDYHEVTDCGSGPAGRVAGAVMALGLGAVVSGMSWTASRAVLDRVLPKPGEGPSESQRAQGRFRMEISSMTTTGARYRTTVAAEHDPGYGGTAIMLMQSALCLALDGPRLPQRSGVLTPATAVGDALVDRLRAQGFTLEVERVG